MQKLNDKELFTFVKLDETKSEKLASAPYSYFRSVLKSFIKKPAAIIGIICMILLIGGAVFIPMFAPEGAFDKDILLISSNGGNPIKPSAKYIWGTDLIGRDLFFSTWKAARYSLWLALISASINVILGIVFGLIWGFFKKLDWLFIEIYNLISNIPSMLIYMLLSTIFVQSVPTMSVDVRLIISLTLIGWIGIARFIRNQVLIITNREYNIASITLGTPARKIMTKNLLPYLMAIIITSSMTIVPGMISSEVTLSYFGLGLPTDSISIGALLELGRRDFLQFPAPLLAPGGILAFIILSFFLVGLALSDALDPRTHK